MSLFPSHYEGGFRTLVIRYRTASTGVFSRVTEVEDVAGKQNRDKMNPKDVVKRRIGERGLCSNLNLKLTS